MQRREAAPLRAACSAGLSWSRSPRRNQCTERQKPRGGDGAAAITGNHGGRLASPHPPRDRPAVIAMGRSRRGAGRGGSGPVLWRPLTAAPGESRPLARPSHNPNTNGRRDRPGFYWAGFRDYKMRHSKVVIFSKGFAEVNKGITETQTPKMARCTSFRRKHSGQRLSTSLLRKADSTLAPLQE